MRVIINSIKFDIRFECGNLFDLVNDDYQFDSAISYIDITKFYVRKVFVVFHMG